MQINLQLIKDFFRPTRGKILFTFIILFFTTRYITEWLPSEGFSEYHAYVSGFPLKYLKTGGNFGMTIPEEINYLYLTINIIILYLISCLSAVIKSWYIVAIAIIPLLLFSLYSFFEIINCSGDNDLGMGITTKSFCVDRNSFLGVLYLIYTAVALFVTQLFRVSKHKIIIAIVSILFGLFQYNLMFGSFESITNFTFFFWYLPAIFLIFAGIHCLCFYKEENILKS